MTDRGILCGLCRSNQTDRQTNRQTDSQTDRQTEREREREKGGGGYWMDLAGVNASRLMSRQQAKCQGRICFGSVRASTLRDRLVGLVVKVSASRAEDPGFESRLRPDISGVESYQKLTLQWLPCQVPGVTGSVLGPVVPVSVYCDSVR